MKSNSLNRLILFCLLCWQSAFCFGQPSQEAAGVADTLIGALASTTDPNKKLEVILQLTDHFYEKGKLEEELQYSLMGYQLAKKLPEGPNTFFALLYYGRTLRQRNEYDKALALYFSALDVYEKYSNEIVPEQEIEVLRFIARAYQFTEVYELSEDYFNQAARKCLAIPDSILYAASLMDLAMMQQEQKKIASYLQNMETSLGILQRNGKEKTAEHILSFMFPLEEISDKKTSNCSEIYTKEVKDLITLREETGDSTSFIYLITKATYVRCELINTPSNDNNSKKYTSLIHKIPTVKNTHAKKELALHLLNTSKLIQDTSAQTYLEQVLKEIDTAEQAIENKVLKNELIRSRGIEKTLTSEKSRLQRKVTLLLLSLFGILAILLLFYIWQKRYRSRLEGKLLQKQLNSHFLRNAMVAIQHDIVTDKKSALDKTSRISRLFHSLYSFNQYDRITLQDEIAFLNDYIAFEQHKSAVAFNFSVIGEASLTKSVTLIPPMLIQPLLENAIHHGGVAKQENGFLQLKLVKKGDNLAITVTNSVVGEGGIAFKSGHSLENIQKRLRLLKAGRLQFKSGEGVTEVKMTIRV